MLKQSQFSTMAETEKSTSENNADANDFYLWTTLYLMEVMRQRLQDDTISQFEIGRGVEGFNTLSNNVVIHAKTKHSGGNMATYALQVKYSIKENNKMDLTYLTKNPKTCIYKFIEAFIDVRKVEQLILWTNMDFAEDVQDYFEEYVPEATTSDLLGAELCTRYRLKKDRLQEIEQHFLMYDHPRVVLVNKVIDAMFSRQTLDSGRVFKEYHYMMARDVVDCNGKKSCFQQSFIDGDLQDEETKKFRDCFMTCMRKRFAEKGLGEFCMQNLNSDSRFQLSVDRKFGKCSKSDINEWDDWKAVLLGMDVADFFDRFVLCVNVAKLETLKTHLIKELVKFDQFDQLCELVRECTSRQMVDHLRIDRIFTLLQLRENVKLNPYIKNELGFDVDGIESLKMEVGKFLNDGCYSVKASNDTDCTVSRLLTILKERFVPDSDQCLLVCSSDLVNEDDAILAVLMDDKLVEFGVKCVIISGMTSDDFPSKIELLQSLEVLTIFVGSDLSGCYVDDFDVSSLDENSKTFIKGKKICWSKTQEATVGEIFSDELFRKENHRLVLELFRSEIIKMEINELQRDPYFIRRLGMNFTYPEEKYASIKPKTVIISDQPGSGKTLELVHIALALRKKYQHYLIVYLDCKAVIKFFEHKKLENMVCQALATDNHVKALLIEEVFHQRKVILLMDGYDEVSNLLRDRLDSVLHNIDERNILLLYIATRPQYEQSIASICPSSSIICQLEPFSEKNQLNYVNKFWDIESIADSELRLIVTQNAKTLVKKFRTMLGDSLVGIPLQTHMIAVIYKAEIRSANFEQPKSFEIGSLYKRFIELKFEETIHHQMNLANATHENLIPNLKETIVPQHSTMARRLLDEVAENTDSAILLQPYGIVRLQPPAFVHKTYQEYFLALYFLTHYTGGNDQIMNFLQDDMIKNILVQEFIDFHIGNIEPQVDLLKNYPEKVSDDFMNSDYVPPSSARLHPNKMREFHMYLDNNRNDEENLQSIEFSLNYSLINLFEVLYDALPYSTKSIIAFSFSPKGVNTNVYPFDSRVNPKDTYEVTHTYPFIKIRSYIGLAEPFVIRMLKILHRKHPEGLIRRYLLDMKRPGNFLRSIFCHTNEAALEWFMTLLPQLSDRDRADFIKHLDNEKCAYLEVIVQKNASQFLQKLIDCLKTIFEPESVAWYLREKHGFLDFTRRIELASENIQVNRRIEMVQSVYELYDWAFGGNIRNRVDIDGFATEINKFNHASIRNAFRETFFKEIPHSINV